MSSPADGRTMLWRTSLLPNLPAVRLGARRKACALFVPGSLRCDYDGCSLHARVLVPADQRDRLEHLCRYVAQPT